jgi:hypothetical protein
MRAFFLGLLLLAAGPALAAEKFVGGNVDARTTLAFKAPEAAVQKFLPEGWELDVATSGPAKDINLRLTFIDRLTAHDAEGKALDPARITTLSIPAKRPVRRRGGRCSFSSTALALAASRGLTAFQSRATPIWKNGFGLTQQEPLLWRNRGSCSPRTEIPSSCSFSMSVAR